MAPTQKLGKRPQKGSSNGSTAKLSPEQGAGLWKLFPVLMVFVGIVVGILWDQRATDGAIGEAKAGSSKEDGETHCSNAKSDLFYLLCFSVLFTICVHFEMFFAECLVREVFNVRVERRGSSLSLSSHHIAGLPR